MVNRENDLVGRIPIRDWLIFNSKRYDTSLRYHLLRLVDLLLAGFVVAVFALIFLIGVSSLIKALGYLVGNS